MNNEAPKTENGFVQLDRTFNQLSSNASKNDDVDIDKAFYVKTLSWADLTTEYRTVVLSEAGSGKTEEIKQAAKRLHAEGKPSFFVRLENIPGDHEYAFEGAGSFAEFQQWLAGPEEGWLFLDSVDEARLRNPRDFERAVAKIGNILRSALDRVHIVVTGRTTAWRPKSDLRYCVEHLPKTPVMVSAPGSESAGTSDAESLTEEFEDDDADAVASEEREDNEPPIFKIVSLADLNSEQIAKFVYARGVTDTKAFLEAVERADAWSFTTRPQDLKDLAAFWNENGRIGNRLDIMRDSVERRLKERDPDRAQANPIAKGKLRNGAKLLAAATTLCKNPTLNIPDRDEERSGIPAADVLSDWNEQEVASLLSRPIFDEAIYGTVRFHHRTVREYLAAEWLADLLARQTSRRKIEDLIFRKSYGVDIISPTMRPILPWLALLDDKVRERVLATAPEVLLEGGEPNALPLGIRRRILRDVCKQISARTERRSTTNRDQVQRFAHHDLAVDVRELLVQYSGNEEIRAFLMRMVWMGQIESLLPEALAVALDPAADRYSRQTALRAMGAVGKLEDFERVKSAFLQEAEELDRELLAEIVSELQPTQDNASWLIDCITKAAQKPEHCVDRLAEPVEEFIGKATTSVLIRLAVQLNALLERPPFTERRHCEVSEQFGWLLTPAAKIVDRLFSERHAASLSPAVLNIVHKLEAAQTWQRDELRGEAMSFVSKIPAWPELNRAIFWNDVEKERAYEADSGARVTAAHQAGHGRFWQFSPLDLEYAITQIAVRTEQDDKLVALSIAFDLYHNAGRDPKVREQLKRAVAGNSELEERLGLYLKPPANPESRRYHAMERRWQKESAARTAMEEKNRNEWKELFATKLDDLKAKSAANPGIFYNPLRYLYDRSEQRGSRSSFSNYGWKSLIPEYGEAVARYYRDSAVGFWRSFTPEIRSEGFAANSTAYGTMFGLVGLQIEARETENWAASLSKDNVRLACRYASFELNGFPPWFPTLFEAHPETVSQFILHEIAWELATEAADRPSHYMLSDAAWSGKWSWQQLAKPLFDAIAAKDILNFENLEHIVWILEGSDLSNEALVSLASAKVATAPTQQLGLWYAVWVGAEPVTGIAALRDRLEALPPSAERTALAMEFVTGLIGDRRGHGQSRKNYHTPNHLKTLYLMMTEFISAEDDIDRANGGVYSPGLRDYAQDGRNALFKMLSGLSGKEAFVAMEQVAKQLPHRPWMARHGLELAEREGDLKEWTPSAVCEFNDQLEKTPANHAELAELAILRMLDLKDDLEEGDTSIAGILKDVKLETDMRKFIGRDLRDKANGRYIIAQEDELADGKKPDIRFNGVALDEPVPMELKLADAGWSGVKLFERLKNQLCGDYLRDRRSARGVFALVTRGQQQTWILPDASSVNFDGLVDALQNYWKEIAQEFPGIDEITVVGIDLTKRSK